MKVLQVIDQAYRTTTEEQDDTILWLTQSMRGAGGDLMVLLSGHGVHYAISRERQPALTLGTWRQTQPAELPRDIATWWKAACRCTPSRTIWKSAAWVGSRCKTAFARSRAARWRNSMSKRTRYGTGNTAPAHAALRPAGLPVADFAGRHGRRGPSSPGRRRGPRRRLRRAGHGARAAPSPTRRSERAPPVLNTSPSI